MKEFRRANEILRTASAFFAAELDLRGARSALAASGLQFPEADS
jgi:hypothetical protein